MAALDKEHLTLKVMRLAPPSMGNSIWPYIEGTQCQSKLGNGSKLVYSAALLLPISQGKVFGGETFSAYIHVANVCAMEATEVVAQVTMSMGSSRYVIYDNQNEPAKLSSNGYFDFTVSYTLSDLGSYMLVCSISYKIEDECKSFKKSFKFIASSPFKISHKIAHLPDKTLVEYTIENQSKQFVVLKDAVFKAIGDIVVDRINESQESQRGRKAIHMFLSNDKYNIIFVLSPTNSNDMLSLQATERLGFLNLYWYTPAGGRGYAEGYQLLNSPLPPSFLELIVVSCPSFVEVDKPFQVIMKVINRLDTPAQLVFSFDKQLAEPFFIDGPFSRHLGKLDPYQSINIPIDVLCLKPGCHIMQGIQVLDLNTLKFTTQSSLCGILVV